MEAVKCLINKGADTTIVDQTGCRAYNYARISGNSELVNSIQLHEPHEYHDYSKRAEELVHGGLPSKVIEVLGISEKRLEYQSENDSSYLVFGTVFDVVYFEYHGFKLFNLLLELDNFEAFGMVTWCPSRQSFVSVDIEHESIYLLHDMTWESFLEDPGTYIDQIIDGNYDDENENKEE